MLRLEGKNMNIAVVDDQEVYHAIVKDYFQDMKEDINIYFIDHLTHLIDGIDV